MFENNLRNNNTNDSISSANKSGGPKREISTDKGGRNSVSNLAAMFGGVRDSTTSNERKSRIVKKSGLGDAFLNKVK
jgi:hypothetical protein